MVFVRKVKTASGATAVQIAERRDGRDRVLEHVGSARTPEQLAALLEVAWGRLHPGQGVLDLGAQPGSVGGAATITGKSSALLWQVLEQAYHRLGFDVVGDESFKQLVLARIVEATSKADSLRVLDEIGVAHASLRTMFRCLGRVNTGGYRDQIAAACFTHAEAHGDISLCLYDVTTLYFEADDEDDLRRVGYSKERRVDPQIVVGLLVDRGGFPLEIGCFEGNHAETRTLIPMIEAFSARHGLDSMVVVADAGMLSAGNLAALDAAGWRFIVGSRVSKAPQDLASHFVRHGRQFRDGQIIDTITPRVATGKARRENDPGLPDEPRWDPDRHPRSWRAVWAYSAARAARDRKTLTAQQQRAMAVISGDRPARTPRFVKTVNGTPTLDQASLDRAAGLCGLKGYVSNIEPALMPPTEVIANYHDLWHVEASFRLSKSDLRARPMFHHTREAIEAHLTIVFAALAVTRYLQTITGISIKKIVRTLRPLQHITVQIAGHEHHAYDPLTPAAQHIITTSATPWPTH